MIEIPKRFGKIRFQHVQIACFFHLKLTKNNKNKPSLLFGKTCHIYSDYFIFNIVVACVWMDVFVYDVCVCVCVCVCV